MKLLTELDSLDNVKDGETRKLVTKTSSSGSGNVVSSVSVSGDTVTYTKGVTALTAHQNAFSNVKVGSTTVAADKAGDTLELVAGSNVTLTPDATNDKVTIAATNTNTTYSLTADTTNNKITLTPSSGTAQSITVPYATNAGAATNDGSGNVIANTYVKKAGDTMTGALTVPQVMTGTNAANYFQCQKFRGQGDAATYYHALDYGYSGHDRWDFYEYGGIYQFHMHKQAAQDEGDTILGTINSNGWEGNVKGNVTGNLTGLATKATGDKNGNDITTTYYLASNPNGYTSNTGTITGVSVNGTSVATSGVANITSVPASILSGAIPSAVTATTQSTGDNSTKIATTAFVKTAIDNLPDPMVFKGSLGTGGTITALPVDGSATVGDTYKVITAGTYASKAAKVGDTFICLTKTSSANTWELIPSGDEPSGTVTSITIKGSSPIAVDSESAITTSGTRTISHANSGVTAGTYRSVTVNATGHVTAGTNPTTLSGYGITDAKITSGTITLGSNTITPLTASSTLNATKVSGTLPTSTYTDTKNTAGSTDSSSKLFLIGATSQAASPQTYSQDTAYVGTDGHLYSNSKQVVNLSDTQALTNKTYNGYTLAGACAKAVVTSVDTSASLPTSNAVKTFVEGKGYVLKSGDTMTGALNFANNVANKFGDDVSIGDFNKAGLLGIIGQNGTTGIALIKNESTWGASAERAEMIYNSTDKCIEFNFV